MEIYTVRKMKMSVCTVDTANQQFKTQKNYGAKKEIASRTVNITKQQKKGY